MMPYKRPESILVVVYTPAAEVLLLRRREPPDYWQSVTGSLKWGETPRAAARRELLEETGLAPGLADADVQDLLDTPALIDCQTCHQFAIHPAWRHRYAPAVTHNLEHVFRLPLGQRQPVILNPREHLESQWLTKVQALKRVSSYTNHDALQRWVPDRDTGP